MKFEPYTLVRAVSYRPPAGSPTPSDLFPSHFSELEVISLSLAVGTLPPFWAPLSPSELPSFAFPFSKSPICISSCQRPVRDMDYYTYLSR